MLYRVFSPCAERQNRFFTERAGEYLKKHKRVFWIVPEQMSVTREAQLASIFPPSSNFSLEVLNFSRLPNRIFRELGGLSFRPVNRTGKLLLLFGALQSLEKELEYLHIPSDRPAAVERLAAQISEFEDFGVDPETLEALAQQAAREKKTDASLKLKDLAKITRRYREQMDASFDDSPSEYRRLLDALSRHAFFSDTVVIVEGFYDFTADQYALMRRMAAQAEELYVGLFSNDPKDGSESPLYARPRKAAKKLALMSDDENRRDVFLPADEQRPAELTHLAEQLCSPLLAYPHPCPAIRLTRCRSAYDEVCYIASTIRRLAKEGTKYSQMAVSFRRDEVYPRLCQSVFPLFDIPFHCSVTEDAARSPVLRLMELACRIAAGDHRLKTFRNYIKTGLTGLSPEESFALENYAITWNVSGKLWFSQGDWVMPPEGYGSAFDEAQRQELERINESKRKLTSPLKSLRTALAQHAPLKDKLKGLCDFLETCGTEEQLAQADARLRQEGSFAQADEQLSLWNAVLDALEQLKLSSGEVMADAGDFCDWLCLALRSCRIGTLPPAPDCVLIGEASFMRSTGIQVLFVPGLNAALFPLEEPAGGILTQAERKLFASQSIELSDAPNETGNEYFLFDRLVRTPSRALYLCYHEKKTAATAACAPSVFVSTLRELFPNLKEEAYDPENALPTCREEAFRYYCSHYTKRTPLTDLLEDYFADDPRTLPLKNASSFADSARDLAHPPLAEGSDVALSQSALEEYTLCRYRYFSHRMLKLKTRPSAYPDSAGEGTMVHELLERFFAGVFASRRPLEEWSETELGGFVQELCEDYFASFPRQEQADEKRIGYLIRRAAKSLLFVVKNLIEELAQSDFVPFLFEAEMPKDLPAFTLPLPDGSRLILRGKIDRVDLYRAEDGREYARIIDYKSSPKELLLQDVYNGLNLQMLLYLFSLWKGGIPQGQGKRQVLPAGVLYVTAAAPWVNLDRSDHKELQKELTKRMQRRGLILDDAEIRRAMEKGEAGIFFSKRNPEKYLATLEQFSLLQRHAEKLLLRTATELKKGRIAPDPFLSGPDSCQNCPYRPVCKFESRPTKRYEYFDSKDDVLCALEEENR